MLKIAGIVIAVVIVAVLAFAATKPDTFEVLRTATINAPPEKIYPLLSDFHNWNAWSPWAKLDPAMKTTHSGPQSGKGAVYTWEGNNKVGSGRMEIAEAAMASSVRINLDFIKPFAGHNLTEFSLQPIGNGATQVTWKMRGPTAYPLKLMNVFYSMDSMIGPDFERGLSQLKATAEK
ncbi:MAG TPA: SRPBCC family protein [Thermoanaerobaculia bacterium]